MLEEKPKKIKRKPSKSIAKCPYCDREFPSQKYVEAHIKNYHEPEKTK